MPGKTVGVTLETCELFALNQGTVMPIVSKLQRRVLILVHFDYAIEHMDGIKNRMADIMKRWYCGYRNKSEYSSKILQEQDII